MYDGVDGDNLNIKTGDVLRGDSVNNKGGDCELLGSNTTMKVSNVIDDNSKSGKELSDCSSRKNLDKNTEEFPNSVSRNVFNKIKSVSGKICKTKNIPNYTDEELLQLVKRANSYISSLSHVFLGEDNEKLNNLSSEKEDHNNNPYKSFFFRALDKINSNVPYLENGIFFEVVIFFCFENLKTIYIANAPIDDNDIHYIGTNKKLSDTLSFYVESINRSEDVNITDSYEEISYALFLLGIGKDYNIIDDIKNENLSVLLQFIDDSMICLKERPNIKKFELLINTLNQLLVILGEFKDTSELVYKVFIDIVNRIECFIEAFLECKGVNFAGIYRPVIYLDLINDSGVMLDSQELQYIITLQSLLSKYYMNFSETEIYLSKNDSRLTKDQNSHNIDKIVDRIFSYLGHGEKLKRSVIDENRKSENIIKIKKTEEEISKEIEESRMFTKGNRAYTKLISLKKKEEFGIDVDKVEVINNIGDIVEMYKFKNNTNSKIETPDDVLKDFIKKEKWKSLDLVCIYSLMLFGNFEPALLRKLVLTIIHNSHKTTFIAEENRKVDILSLVVEQIVRMVSTYDKLLICDKINCNESKCYNPKKQVCHRLINKVEEYIEKNSKDGLFFNYSRLYLSLAYLYSSALNKSISTNSYATNFYVQEIEGLDFLNGEDSIDSTSDLVSPNNEHYAAYWEKTTMYYNAYMERLGDDNIGENELIKRIHENILNNLLPNASTSEEKSKLIMDTERKKISMKERLSLQYKISDIILEIQTSSVFKDNGLEDIKNKICTTIGNVLFKGGCNIFILPPQKKPNIGRFQKSEVIEGKDFDIVFVYHKSYENTFKYIFDQESDYIKTNISQLIDIHEKYSKAFKYLQTVIGGTSAAMSIKDTYTKGHIERVVEFSLIIGKILGLDRNDLLTLKVQAILHDFGKLFIDDSILKKPGKLSWDEMKIMNSHTGIGIEKALEHGFLPELIEGNAHHCKYYSVEGDSELTYEEAVDRLKRHMEEKSGKTFDYSIFNKLMGNNIPKFARILQLGDIKDAIASRRIYEDRAGYTIEEIIRTIESEFINCAGLKFDDNGLLVLDKGKWIEATDENKRKCYVQKEINSDGQEITYVPNPVFREVGKIDLDFPITFLDELFRESGILASFDNYVPCRSYIEILTDEQKHLIRDGIFSNSDNGNKFHLVGKDMEKWWGLKIDRENKKIDIDETKWIEAKTEDQKNHPSRIKKDNKIYIPDPDNKTFKTLVIEFDPLMVKETFSDPSKVIEMRNLIIETDKKEILSKIEEFRVAIEQLKKKRQVYEKVKIMKGKIKVYDEERGIASDESCFDLLDIYNFSDEEERNLTRMETTLPKLIGIAEGYGLTVPKSQDS